MRPIPEQPIRLHSPAPVRTARYTFWIDSFGRRYVWTHEYPERGPQMTATTRAKFRCNIAKPFSGNYPGGTVELTPVASADPEHENKQFWDATPSGKIEMHINNPNGFATFEQDQEYYVDFTPAPAE